MKIATITVSYDDADDLELALIQARRKVADNMRRINEMEVDDTIQVKDCYSDCTIQRIE